MVTFYKSPLYLAFESDGRHEPPVPCHVVRFLAVDGVEARAAVIQTHAPVRRSPARDFVALATGRSTLTAAFRGELVGIRLLPLDARAGAGRLDLGGGLEPAEDGCVLSASREAVQRWQSGAGQDDA